jgi:sugar (pentulose or hexulose) kinase
VKHEPLVCGIDVGTSSVRAALVDASGRMVVTARTERNDAARLFDASKLWDQVTETLIRLMSSAGDAVPAALAVAGHVGSVLLDEHDRPAVAAGGWSDDRGVEELRRHQRAAPELWANTGRPTPTSGALALLCWLSALQPETAARVRSVLTPKDYLNLQLTGARATDATSAAYLLGLDVARRSWHVPLLGRLGVSPHNFPDLYRAADVIGVVGADVARRTGLPAGIPVAAGGPDGTVGAAAILGTRTDSIVDIAGTTDVLVQVIGGPHPPAAAGRMIINPYLVGDYWSQGGPTGMTGGAVTAWLALLGSGGADPGNLSQQAITQINPGSDGLLAIPHLTGSRFPAWRDDERASLAGLAPHHSPAHIMRAVHEGAAFAVREALDLMDPSGRLPVVLAGGVAKSPGLVSLRADVYGRPVARRTAPDASLLGAARLAQLAIGLISGLDEPISEPGMTATAVPDQRRAALYAETFQRWRSIRQALLNATPADAEVAPP